jgi:hypothetical protein
MTMPTLTERAQDDEGGSPPNPDQPQRRRFTAEYKLAGLAEYDGLEGTQRRLQRRAAAGKRECSDLPWLVPEVTARAGKKPVGQRRREDPVRRPGMTSDITLTCQLRLLPACDGDTVFPVQEPGPVKPGSYRLSVVEPARSSSAARRARASVGIRLLPPIRTLATTRSLMSWWTLVLPNESTAAASSGVKRSFCGRLSVSPGPGSGLSGRRVSRLLTRLRSRCDAPVRAARCGRR